jgi:alanine racemase
VINYHLKVDTGMGRLGVPFHQLSEFLKKADRLTHVKLDGLMTHLASADEPEKSDFTRHQIELFNRALAMIETVGVRPTHRHSANSAGMCGYPEAWANMVRVGAVLYGLWRDILPLWSPIGNQLSLKPVMSLHTRIMFLKTVGAGTPVGYGCTFTTERESRIATLPIGYHDGYWRAFSNRARVIVRGQWAPVVGRVSMDLTLIDVTDIPNVQVGDAVVLIGEADGLSVTAEDLAELAGTVSYEIVCGISPRVPRITVGEALGS